MKVVVMGNGDHRAPFVYGPFEDMELAQQFADFLTAEVDPATVINVIHPADELVGWWRTHRQEKP